MRLFTFIGISILFTMFNYLHAGVFDDSLELSEEAKMVIKDNIDDDKTSGYSPVTEEIKNFLDKAVELFRKDTSKKLARFKEGSDKSEEYQKHREKVNKGDTLAKEEHKEFNTFLMSVFEDNSSEEMQEYTKLYEALAAKNEDAVKFYKTATASSDDIITEIQGIEINDEYPADQAVNDTFKFFPFMVRFMADAILKNQEPTKTDSSGSEEEAPSEVTSEAPSEVKS